jgi:hypothetical protein
LTIHGITEQRNRKQIALLVEIALELEEKKALA